MKRRNSNEFTLKEAIEAMIDKLKVRDQVNQAKLLSNWKTLVGPAIARHTTDIGVYKGKLQLYIDSPIMKQELFLRKDQLKKKVNEFLGTPYIKEVSIK